jgi:hypothetical protein
MSMKEEKKILDEVDEKRIFGETIRLFDGMLKDKTLTREQDRQAVKEYVAIPEKVIAYHRGRLKRMKCKYIG